MNTRGTLAETLSSASEEIAQSGLARLRNEDLRGEAGYRLAMDVAESLGRSAGLSKRLQATRLRRLLAMLPLSIDVAERLAAKAPSLPSHLRLALAEALPPELRVAAYASPKSSDTPSGATAFISHPPSAQEAGTDSAAPVSADAHSASADLELPVALVLLLSHPDHQDANKTLLASHDLDSIVISTIEELAPLMAGASDICGCVIDHSFLQPLNEEGQRALFEQLAEHSTFMVLRIHDSALQVSRLDLLDIVRRARRLDAAVPGHVVWFDSDRRLRETELVHFHSAAELLRSHVSATLVLGDLSSDDERLVVAALRERTQSDRFDRRADVSRVTLRPLSGGRSGALLLTVRGENGEVYVAKITDKDVAREEVRRFRTFVQDLMPESRPQCFYHGNAAVILSSLVRSDEDRQVPAEPIEARLADIWNGQWMGGDDADLRRRADLLGRALVRVAARLCELNSTTPANDEERSYVNPPITHLLALDRDGFEWGFDADVLRARDSACTRCRNLETAAVVHGDLHLRNILVRGDSEVHLIDFASAGPGHPCIDLVRLELALYLGPVRQFEDDADCEAFQHALSVDRAPIAALEAAFPRFFRCHVNRASAVGMVAARDRALAAVHAHGGDVRDYHAVKLLVAWQSLALMGQQGALARAAIRATASAIGQW